VSEYAMISHLLICNS